MQPRLTPPIGQLLTRSIRVGDDRADPLAEGRVAAHQVERRTPMDEDQAAERDVREPVERRRLAGLGQVVERHQDRGGADDRQHGVPTTWNSSGRYLR